MSENEQGTHALPPGVAALPAPKKKRGYTKKTQAVQKKPPRALKPLEERTTLVEPITQRTVAEELAASLNRATPPAAVASRETVEKPQPPPAPTSRPSRRREDPEIAASRLAEKMADEEAQARYEAAQRRRTRGARAEGGPVQTLRATRRYTPYDTDRTRLSAEVAKKIKLGYVPEWTRTVDMFGKPDASQMQVEMSKAYGGEIVRNNDGSPVVSPYGMLMQLPPDGYAQRVVDRSPTGIRHTKDAHDAVYDAVETENRRAGQEVARITGEGAQPDREFYDGR